MKVAEGVVKKEGGKETEQRGGGGGGGGTHAEMLSWAAGWRIGSRLNRFKHQNHLQELFMYRTEEMFFSLAA